jgi:hypothetical protein
MTYVIKAHDPRCHYCGKPLKRVTVNHYRDTAGGFTGEFRSKAEIETAGITNHRVLSVAKDEATGIVWTFSTWDGESYRDDMFCTNRCAELMGRAAARAGYRIKRGPREQDRDSRRRAKHLSQLHLNDAEGPRPSTSSFGL